MWFYGKLNRSAWLDANLRQFPQAVGENTLFDHESGMDADGSAMTSFITSSDFDIGDGEKFTLVKRIIPDVFSGVLLLKYSWTTLLIFYLQRPANPQGGEVGW